MIISAVQFCPRYAEPDENKKVIFGLFKKSKGAISVFPELAVSGYLFSSREKLEKCSLDADDPYWDQIETECRKNQRCFVCGFCENDKGILYNSAIFIGSTGNRFIYRKVHLFDREKIFFAPGNGGFLLVEDQGVKIGVLICFDHMFPEAARTLSLQGAQIICHPSNLVLPGNAQLSTRVRSMENKIYWILANRTGSECIDGYKLEYTGCSQIVDISGKVLASADKDQEVIIEVQIPPTEALNKKIGNTNDIFSDRRTEFYKL